MTSFYIHIHFTIDSLSFPFAFSLLTQPYSTYSAYSTIPHPNLLYRTLYWTIFSRLDHDEQYQSVRLLCLTIMRWFDLIWFVTSLINKNKNCKNSYDFIICFCSWWMSSSLYYHPVRPFHSHETASVCVESEAPEQDAEVSHWSQTIISQGKQTMTCQLATILWQSTTLSMS